MKLGGRNEISTPEAIAGLVVIAMICLIASLVSVWKSIIALAYLFVSVVGICIICIVILWQIDLNDSLSQSRSDSESAKSIWNIFQIGDVENENTKGESKNVKKKTLY